MYRQAVATGIVQLNFCTNNNTGCLYGCSYEWSLGGVGVVFDILTSL